MAPVEQSFPTLKGFLNLRNQILPLHLYGKCITSLEQSFISLLYFAMYFILTTNISIASVIYSTQRLEIYVLKDKKDCETRAGCSFDFVWGIMVT